MNNAHNIRFCVESGELPPAPTPFRSFLRRLFCWHAWKFISDQRYNVTGKNGHTTGSTYLLILECKHCHAERVIEHDRKVSK